MQFVILPPSCPPDPQYSVDDTTANQHFQGITRSSVVGHAPILYVTRAGNPESARNKTEGAIWVVEMGSRNQSGERLRSNRLAHYDETQDTAALTTGTVSARHDYTAVPGVYTVTACVSDDDGDQSCDSLDVTVVHGFLRCCGFADEPQLGLTIAQGAEVNCAESESGASGEMRTSGIASRGYLRIKQDSVLDGLGLSLIDTVHVGQDADISGTATAGRDIAVDRGTKIHDSVFAGRMVRIRRDVIIDGDVTAVGKVRVDQKAKVAGEINADSTVPPVPDVTFLNFTFAPGIENITVDGAAPYPLEPGVYGNVKVESGATLILSGQYLFEGFELEENASLQVDLSTGPLLVDVAGNLRFQKDVYIEIISDGDAGEILFRIAGEEVELHKDGRYLGTYLAPNAKIKMGDNGLLIGALYGQQVDIGKGVRVEGLAARDLFVSLFVVD